MSLVVMVGLALSSPALAQQAKGEAHPGGTGGFVQGGRGDFPPRGGAKSWVFDDDEGEDAASALSRATRDMEKVTRDSQRMMDYANDAADAADRMDQRMGTAHNYLPEDDEPIAPNLSKHLSGSGVAVEYRGRPSSP